MELYNGSDGTEQLWFEVITSETMHQIKW